MDQETRSSLGLTHERDSLTIQKGQCGAQINEHVFDENRRSLQLVHPIPEPHHNRNNKWEEDGFQCQPHLGEATVLIDNCQMQIANVANIQIHLPFRVDRQTNVQQIEIMMQ